MEDVHAAIMCSAWSLFAWECNREARANYDERPYCILHLPRGHPAKDRIQFWKVLYEELSTARVCGSWDLGGVVFPAAEADTPEYVDYVRNYVRLFLQTEGIRVNLSQAVLQGLCLVSSKLRDATLIGANLRNTLLSELNLNGANLWGADLSGANIDGCKMCNVDLDSAHFGRVDLGRAALLLLRQPILLLHSNRILSRDEAARQFADTLRRVRVNLSHYGHQEKADSFYLQEMRARRKILRYYSAYRIDKQKRRPTVRRLWDWLRFRTLCGLSYLFDKVARYGNSPGLAFLWAVTLIVGFWIGLLFTQPDLSRIECLFHSVSAFTTLGMTVTENLDNKWIQALTIVEAWLGSMIMAIFLFSLGRKALR